MDGRDTKNIEGIISDLYFSPLSKTESWTPDPTARKEVCNSERNWVASMFVCKVERNQSKHQTTVSSKNIQSKCTETVLSQKYALENQTIQARALLRLQSTSKCLSCAMYSVLQHLVHTGCVQRCVSLDALRHTGYVSQHKTIRVTPQTTNLPHVTRIQCGTADTNRT